MDAALGEAGLTSSQYAALANLEEEPGLSNAELARRSFVTPQTMIRIVTGLAERGFVARVPRPGHGRAIDTRLTAAGTGAATAGHRIVARVETELAGRLTAKERAELTDLLSRLADTSSSGDGHPR